jgi:hypothetical protein
LRRADNSKLGRFAAEQVVNGLQERTSPEMMDGFNIRHGSKKFGRYDIQHSDTRNIDIQHNYNLSMKTLSLTMHRITMLSMAALSMTVLPAYWIDNNTQHLNNSVHHKCYAECPDEAIKVSVVLPDVAAPAVCPWLFPAFSFAGQNSLQTWRATKNLLWFSLK